MISIIAAIDRNNGLGYKNDLLFHLSADLRRFKALTTSHTVIMGRKTFDSLPKGPLPNRRNIVLSRCKDLRIEGAEVYHDLQEALEHCTKEEEVFIMGGASLYAQAMPLADRLCMTFIDAQAEEVDVFFPEIDPEIWEEESREQCQRDEKNPHDYAFVNFIRRI